MESSLAGDVAEIPADVSLNRGGASKRRAVVKFVCSSFPLHGKRRETVGREGSAGGNASVAGHPGRFTCTVAPGWLCIFRLYLPFVIAIARVQSSTTVVFIFLFVLCCEVMM